MKKYIIVFLIAGLLGCSSDNETGNTDIPLPAAFLGEVDWVKSFGGTNEDTAQSVIKTSDGGYAILGYTNSTDGDLVGKTTEVNDFWLVKLDEVGNLQWSRTYGGSKDDRGTSVIQTSDEGYVLVGYAMSSDGDGSNNEGFHDNWILKLNSSGEIEWEKSFGFSGHDHSYDVVQTADDGFFFVGFLDVTASGGAGGETSKGNFLTRHGVGEFWGIKLDAQGNLEWRRFFGGTGNDRAYGVVKTADEGFILTGSTESNDFDISDSRGSYDIWVIKITGEGDIVWEQSFGGTGIDKAWDIANTDDNAYVIVGNTFSTDIDVTKNNGESDMWLIKIDDMGNLVWEQSYGGSQFDSAQSVSAAADGGFILSGNSKSLDSDVTANVGENDIWIVKIDTNGKLLWQKSFGGGDLDYGIDAVSLDDHSILLVGETRSNDFPELQHKGASDMVALKIK